MRLAINRPCYETMHIVRTKLKLKLKLKFSRIIQNSRSNNGNKQRPSKQLKYLTKLQTCLSTREKSKQDPERMFEYHIPHVLFIYIEQSGTSN